MNDPGHDLALLKERARRLALDKSYLQLVVSLMTRAGSASGVDDVIDNLLRNILDVLGGTNVSLYYRVDSEVWRADVYGARQPAAIPPDSDVDRVFKTGQPIEVEHDFRDTRLTTAPFTKAYTWVYPLAVGPDVLAVVVMENLHIGMRSLYAHLPLFFNYAAQILKNEVRNYDRLHRAYEDLNRANASLVEEIAVRERAEAALRETKDGLEATVERRTAELRHANEELRLRNATLDVFNRLLTGAVAAVEARDLLALGCHELTSLIHAACGYACLIDAAGTTATVIVEFAGVSASGDNLAPAAVERIRRLVASGTPLASVSGVAPWEEELAAPFGHPVGALLVVPLRIDAQTFGAVVLGRGETQSFTTDECDLAASVAGQLEGAVARQHAQADARRLRTAIEQSPESVVITNDHGEIVYVNPSFCQATGYERAEVIGRLASTFRSIEHDSDAYQEMLRTVEAGKVWRGRLYNRRRNGDLITEAAVITPIRDERGRVTHHVSQKRDVTQELAREDRMRHSQRIEAIGQLAGGIAHDFNNILGTIALQLEMMSMEHQLPPAVTDGIAEVRRAADRAGSLTRQLLSFGRRQPMRIGPQDLNQVAASALELLERVLTERVTIAFARAPHPVPFSGDAALIGQVLMNLAINAHEAMPEGGRLTISTAVEDVAEPRVIDQPDVGPGRYAVLTVADTGRGMKPEVLEHLFEPFFTTKAVGGGPGLGLATAHGIVSQHAGWIAVESAPGKGSVFTVFLPALTAVEEHPPAPAIEAIEQAPRTILLVEDEPGIRRMTQRGLEKLGYRVVTAASGVEAYRLWQGLDRPADLLLTDVVMPEGLSGVELTRRLRQDHPTLRVILMSGYPADMLREGGRIDDNVEYLAKPFTLSQLGAMVERALARRRGAGA